MRSVRRGDRRTSLLAALATAIVAGAQLVARPLTAQVLPPPDVAAVVGVFDYDIQEHGDGSALLYGVRVRFPLSRFIQLEPSLVTTRYTASGVPEGVDERVRLVVLDFQVQLQLPLDGPSPYVGIGAGGVFDLRGERGDSEYVVSTYSAVGGVAIELAGGLGLRGELRLRGIDETRNSAMEYGVGLSLDF